MKKIFNLIIISTFVLGSFSPGLTLYTQAQDSSLEKITVEQPSVQVGMGASLVDGLEKSLSALKEANSQQAEDSPGSIGSTFFDSDSSRPVIDSATKDWQTESDIDAGQEADDLYVIDIKEATPLKVQESRAVDSLDSEKPKITITSSSEKIDPKQRLKNEATLDSSSKTYEATTASIMEYYDGIEEHPIENLLYYLSQNQNDDGSFGSFNQYELTSQIAVKLSNYAKIDNDQYVLALDYLVNTAPKNNREKAIRARLLKDTLPAQDLQDLLDELLAGQNSDGSFGLGEYYTGDVETTLEVVLAFWVNNIVNEAVTGGLYYVVNQIQADGSMSYFSDSEPNYFLVNQTAEYLKPFAGLSVGPPEDTVNIDDKTALLLNFLSSHYDEAEEELMDAGDIADELMTLHTFQLYETETTKQEQLFSNAKAQQNFDGSFGSSLYGAVAAMKALPQADLEITSLVSTGSLINNQLATFQVTIKNKGYKTISNAHLYNFIDNFKINDGYDLGAIGFSANPQEEINLNIEFSENITIRMVGETEVKFYIEGEDEFDYKNNWQAENFTFASNGSDPGLPVLYVAYKYDLNGSPAVNVRWIKKDDPNRMNYVFMYRPLGDTGWSFIGISNDSNGSWIVGFPEDTAYEVTTGVLHLDGSTVTYFPEITQIMTSSDPAMYTGDVSGYVTLNNERTSDIYTNGIDVASTTDLEGNFFYQAEQNGMTASRVYMNPYEEIWTKFSVPNGGTTEDVRLFTRLKEDDEVPVIDFFRILYEDDFVFNNQSTKDVYLSPSDNVAAKEADIYYYDPFDDAWIYLYTKDFGPYSSIYFDWYVPAELFGSGYKLKSIVWDYQDNVSDSVEWGPFEITNTGIPNQSPQFNSEEPDEITIVVPITEIPDPPVTASDPDLDDIVSLTIENKPSWVTIMSSFSGNPASMSVELDADESDIGDYTFTLAAEDNHGARTEHQMTVHLVTQDQLPNPSISNITEPDASGDYVVSWTNDPPGHLFELYEYGPWNGEMDGVEWTKIATTTDTSYTISGEGQKEGMYIYLAVADSLYDNVTINNIGTYSYVLDHTPLDTPVLNFIENPLDSADVEVSWQDYQTTTFNPVYYIYVYGPIESPSPSLQHAQWTSQNSVNFYLSEEGSYFFEVKTYKGLFQGFAGIPNHFGTHLVSESGQAMHTYSQSTLFESSIISQKNNQ